MKHRLDGRSYNDRIGKPYYGASLRRIIAPEVTDPSWIERMSEWWSKLTVRDAKIATVLILAAMFCAAVIVAL